VRTSRGALVAGVVLAVASAGVGVGPSAGAASPPRDGTVSCGASGNVRFAAPLQYGVGNKPNQDANVRFRTTPTGCSGTQTGGSPRRPGPITGGTLVAKGRGTGHRCLDMTMSGIHAIKTKITWRDAGGHNLGMTTIAAATATVANLGSGTLNFPPPVTPPGIITFTLTGVADASSTAFPGRNVSATFVADHTVASFMVPCSIKYPPQKIGLDELKFTGVQGPSSVAVS
jgi:hypothetical protein